MTPADTNPLREALAAARAELKRHNEEYQHRTGAGVLALIDAALASEPVAGTVKQWACQTCCGDGYISGPTGRRGAECPDCKGTGRTNSPNDPALSAPAPTGREDADHPDCATDRECELYDALMGLASHAMANYPNYRKWSQGGLVLAPVVARALRLAGSEVTPHGRGAVDWVTCPICDELDMRKETFDEGAALIHCTNHGCASNGALKGRGLKFEYDADREVRLSSGLIAIHQAPANVTADAMRSVAYDIAFNCIPVDVAEFQLERRSTTPAPGAADRERNLRRLVIAARTVCSDNQGPDAIRALDKASEAFSELVAWENDPSDEIAPANTGETGDCPNGLHHGNCGYPNCVSSCPGRLSLSRADRSALTPSVLGASAPAQPPPEQSPSGPRPPGGRP